MQIFGCYEYLGNYKNYVQKATDPKIYKVPFIGRDSRKKRIEILNNTTYTEQEKTYLLDELDKNFRESQLGRLEDL